MIYPFSHTKSRKLLRVVSATAAAFLCATMFTGCFKKDPGPSTDPSSGPNLVESGSTEPSTEATTAATTEATTEAPKENVAVVKEKVNTYSSPSLESNVLQALNAGDEVEVNRVETMPVTGLTWAYIPLKGWVQTDYLDMTNVTIQGSNSTPAGNNDSNQPTTTTAPSSNTGNSNTSNTGSGQVGTVTASELNIRKTPSKTADSVGKYVKGNQITILETNNGWGRTDKGWVSLNYVSFGGNTGANTNTGNTGNTTTNNTTTTTGGTKGVVTATQLNIRESAATTANRAGSYSYGDRITILETSNGWGRTDKGWVSLNYVYQDGTTGTNTAKGIVTGTTLNVRSGPGTNYNSVANYSNLTRVNILEQIKVGGTTWGCTKDGWISLDYVYIDGTTGEGAGTGTVSGSNVNIRSGPGTGYNIVGSYNRGDTVEIYAQFTFGNTKWGCTNKGWVSMDYVEVG